MGEPARFYFHLCGNQHHRDHVNVHGLNGFLCIIQGALAAQLPIIPMVEDPDTWKGCADIWAGLTEDAWAVFGHPENFGKDFEGIPKLKRGACHYIKSKSYSGFQESQALVGRSAADLQARARRGDPALLPYVRKYAHFFSCTFLVRRMFEVLNAETNAEYAGFGMACGELYPWYKEQFDLEEATLLEHLYDEYLMNLDVQKADRFFQWLGVTKGSTQDVGNQA